MYNSILHFLKKDIIEIEKVVGKVLKDEKDVDDLTDLVHEKVLKLGTNLLSEIYEKLDEQIRESIVRKKHWNIEHRNQQKTILTIMGEVKYKRTGYYTKGSGKKDYIYLLDKVLGYEPGQRMCLGAAAMALEEAVESSYRKGGKRASITEEVSKQAIKDLVHSTAVKMPIPKLEKKKKKKHVYILTDEDHVSAQFWKEKGDLRHDSRGYKTNTIISKMICVYDGAINISGPLSKAPRYELKGKRYFSGVYKGTKKNYELWKEVSDYIEATYDTEYLEQIYILGDGANWIKAGCEYIADSKFVLDKFHMMKYINTSVSHLQDSTWDAKNEIWEAIDRADKEELKSIYNRIINATESESKQEAVLGSLRYFMNNWDGIKIRHEEPEGRFQCSAEGQVSHLLSSRLSSRPMGWSELGCHNISQLRAYKKNGGEIIDLLKYKKEKQKKEERRAEQEELIKELRKKQSGWDYSEIVSSSIPGLEKSSMKWMRGLVDHALGL